ncbi:hypothetical protein MMC27_003958 [Xylographa pallens]|nr:hypothetical protein [Xylographa pallens]
MPFEWFRFTINVLLLLSVPSSVLLQCAAQSGKTPSTYWTSPLDAGLAGFYAEDTVYQTTTTAQLRWVTNETFYSIYLFQQQSASYAALGPSIYTKVETSPEQGGFTWTVGLESFSLANSSVFFFSLAPSGALTKQAFTSHYFNISKSAVPITTTSSSRSIITTATSTAKPTSTSLSTTTTSSTPISTSPPSSASPSPSSLETSSTTTHGLSIGLGIGIPLILLLLTLISFLIYRRRKQDRSYGIARQNEPTVQQRASADPFERFSGSGLRLEKYRELPGEERLAELGTVEERERGAVELGVTSPTR